jgi:hypothetical protein
MSVRELVAEPRLNLELLVEGDLQRTIRWVHSSEMPEPGRYLHGAEVVLSAGIWYWSGVKPHAWVASLIGARAAAVGFGVTLLHPTVPADLVDACREAGLTLFRLPLDVAFISVAEAFTARYVADHERPLRDAVRRNQQLIAAVAAGEGIGGILQVIAMYRPGSAYVASPSLGLMASSGPAPDDAAVRAAVALGGRPGYDFMRATRDGDPIVRPIVGAAGAGAYLVLDRVEPSEPLASRVVVDQAIPYLGLELQRHVAVRESERRIAGELFDLVMAGPGLLPAARSRLGTLGMEATDSFVALVADTPGPEQALARLETSIARDGLRGLVAVKGVQVWGVLCWDRAETEIRPLAVRLTASLGADGSLGVGRPVQGIESLRESLVDARHACRIARQRRNERFATHAEVGSHSLLLALTDDSALRSFRSAVLGPVIDYDARRGTELLRTLETFLGSAGQYGATARALSVHVNTLRLRLARIESLTGRSLGRAEDQVDLYLALRVDAPSDSIMAGEPGRPDLTSDDGADAQA